PFRNHALEVFVFNRMVLDLDGEMFLPALPGKSLRQRPGFQHSFHLQAKVVMQPARSMLLNYESGRTFDLFWNELAGWLAGFLEVAFAFVFGQRHRSKLNQNCTDDTITSGARPAVEPRDTMSAIGNRDYKAYASLGSGSPTRYRTKRRM